MAPHPDRWHLIDVVVGDQRTANGGEHTRRFGNHFREISVLDESCGQLVARLVRYPSFAVYIALSSTGEARTRRDCGSTAFLQSGKKVFGMTFYTSLRTCSIGSGSTLTGQEN